MGIQLQSLVLLVVLAVVVGGAAPRDPGAGAGGERPVVRERLPERVRRTADAEARGATVRGYSVEVERGRRVYEVTMTRDGHAKSVTIAADGRVLEVEEAVAVSTLPAEVVSALRNRADRGDVTGVESVTRGGVLVAYEAHVVAKGRRFAIRVGPKGETVR